MKTFVCELCGSTQFAKSNGMFVCQGCGTAFSAEDMRGMMAEVSDAEPEAPLSRPKPTPKPKPEPMPEPVVEEPEEAIYEEEAEEEAPVRPVAPKPTARANSAAPNNKEEKKKKISVGMIISIAATAVLFIFFIVGLVMAFDKESTSGNVLLLVGGIFDLIIAFVLYKVMIHLERYNCPKCGAKRVHHREYKRTTKKEKEFKDSSITTYTHHYHDTYECPQCGETRHEQVTGSGGSYYEYDNGNDRDATRPPKEF